MKEKRSFQGIWIPAEVWKDHALSWVEKIMLVEINSLQDPKKGGCYASNGYFGEFFQLSKSRISEIISQLHKKRAVRLHLHKVRKGGEVSTQRIIKVVHPALRKTEPPPSRSRIRYSENGESINTVNKLIPVCGEIIKKIKIRDPALARIFEEGEAKLRKKEQGAKPPASTS